MKRRICLIFLIGVVPLLYADDRSTIDSLVDQVIFIQDGWAGQSLTLKKDNAGYFVIRTYFGSGLPVVGTVRYTVSEKNPYQVRFSEIEDRTGIGQRSVKQEEFFLSMAEDGGIELFLNGLRVVADIPKSIQ